MKKLFAILLCCVLLVGLLTACGGDTADPDTSAAAPSDGATEASAADPATEAPAEHNGHINYKGLETADFTLDDVIAVEGREPDFSFDAADTTFYAYNDVAMDDLTFSQVQFSFSDTGNRISCTCSGDEDTAVVMERIRDALTAQYGEPSGSDSMYSWSDGQTANYVMLTKLNETTVQLAYYIVESAG